MMNENQSQNEPLKVEVTAKVEGKFENGCMNLYMDDSRIGKIKETNEGTKYEMARGFEFDNNKIFRYEEGVSKNPDKYVEGCDMGWC
ncbi:YusG family protein [Alkalihalobacillus sp. LMS39]|uniref:YusG family protein n=1 Tax=Alkalihalobacillus sp. LMS39 TaxID=2924032 RepID=UPI001FB255C2|nr:YusG family protein [Alkalihalobacillus sp. LMS39]UOE93691.1 YusG family protein [Alkalihalobacillus sp. LMS39]